MTRKAFLIATVILGMSPIAQAQDFSAGSIVVSQPWARATPGMARNGAAYMTISIRGAKNDKLTHISTPVAKKAELHSQLMVNNIMRMRRIEVIEISPGSPSVMGPGGLHVMLMGLHAPLKKGAKFPLILTFEKAGQLTVEATIHGIGARSPSPQHK
ncbi:MAG: copper chaperone PCu(A)C [Alphaproteobacteria bacterium]